MRLDLCSVNETATCVYDRRSVLASYRVSHFKCIENDCIRSPITNVILVARMSHALAVLRFTYFIFSHLADSQETVRKKKRKRLLLLIKNYSNFQKENVIHDLNACPQNFQIYNT